jgi:hypothetical protein
MCHSNYVILASLRSSTSSTIIEATKPVSEAASALMAYYYFDFRDSAKQGVRGLLTSLLTQLSAKSDRCSGILSGLYSRHNSGSLQPGDDELKQCFVKMLLLPEWPTTYIIVDALDECQNTSGVVSPRKRVLDLVKELIDLRLPTLRLCMTSRPEADIVLTLGPLASHAVSLHDQNGQNQDIADYVRSVVESDERMREWPPEDKELVIGTLVLKAEGM